MCFDTEHADKSVCQFSLPLEFYKIANYFNKHGEARSGGVCRKRSVIIIKSMMECAISRSEQSPGLRCDGLERRFLLRDGVSVCVCAVAHIQPASEMKH